MIVVVKEKEGLSEEDAGLLHTELEKLPEIGDLSCLCGQRMVKALLCSDLPVRLLRGDVVIYFAGYRCPSCGVEDGPAGGIVYLPDTVEEEVYRKEAELAEEADIGGLIKSASRSRLEAHMAYMASKS